MSARLAAAASRASPPDARRAEDLPPTPAEEAPSNPRSPPAAAPALAAPALLDELAFAPLPLGTQPSRAESPTAWADLEEDARLFPDDYSDLFAGSPAASFWTWRG